MMTYAHIDRPLTDVDLSAPAAESESSPAPLARLSERHRRLARMLAEGVSEQDAGLAVGLLPVRVSVLKADPTFRHLIDFYRRQVEDNYLSVHEKLGELTNLATDEIILRLEVEAEKFDLSDLMELTKLGADRTGHAPAGKSTAPTVTFNIGARLDAAQSRVIEGKAKYVNEE